VDEPAAGDAPRPPVVPRRRRLARWGQRLLAVLAPLFSLWLWQESIDSGLVDPRWFSPPSAIVGTIAVLVISGEIGRHLGLTALRLLLGFLLGAVPALLLARARARSGWARAGCGPLAVLLTIFWLLPIYLLAVRAFQVEGPGTIPLVTMVVFFPLLFSGQTAGSAAAGSASSVADAPLAPRSGRRWRLQWLPPSARTFLRLRLAAWAGLLVLLIAEMFQARAGLGYIIWQSWLTFSRETLFAALVFAALLAYATWRVFDALEWLAARL